jgi:CBS domain-containing protein
MHVRDIMTEDPACCAPDASIRDAARLMVENDCGEIPVTDERGAPVGVVTDRDIACRAVAQGKSLDTPVSEIMSSPAVTVTPETTLEDCCATLEENQLRRAPVVDENGSCCGIVAQADIARNAPEHETAEVVRDVSQPSRKPAGAGCC